MANDGQYEKGVPWNGLSAVNETPSGGEPTAVWEQGNLFGQITVGIPINESYLIAVIQQVRPIVGERRLNTLTLVNDAVVFHWRAHCGVGR